MRKFNSIIASDQNLCIGLLMHFIVSICLVYLLVQEINPVINTYILYYKYTALSKALKSF